MALRLTATQPRPTLALYDVDGATKIANLPLARGIQFQHELSAPGTLSFSLPLGGAFTGSVVGKRIVKVFWKGRARFAARIETAGTDLAVDGTVWRQWQAQPGIMDTLNDACVNPEYGLRATSGQTRTFGFMSRQGHWFDSGNFTGATGLDFTDDTGLKKGRPVGLKAINPQWIAKDDPYTNKPPNSSLYYRRSFDSLAFAYSMAMGFDDYGWVYVDGEQVFSPDKSDHTSWRTLQPITGAFTAGHHVVAVRVQNSSIDGEENPVSMIGAIQQLNDKGEPVKGPAFIKTNSLWIVSDVTPGWNAAEVLSRLITEAREADIPALTVLGRGFTDEHDTAGVAWSTIGEFTFDIGTGLLDVAQQFAEHHFDLDVDADSLTLLAYDDLGTDRSGSVILDLGVNAGSLKGHTVARVWPRHNSAIIQLADGRWIVQEDSASVSDHGRAQMGLALGSTSETDTAAEVASAQFSETAKSTFVFTSALSTLAGPQPYLDYFLGDSVSVPNEDGDGYMKARVMSITVDASGEVVTVNPELMWDTSA